MSASTALAVLAAPISSGSGPGVFLRILVAAAVVGVVVMAILLLRGYRD